MPFLLASLNRTGDGDLAKASWQYFLLKWAKLQVKPA
jgi:hypothetical protein